MNSKNHAEVRNRRAKAGGSRLNLYQKMVLVAGVLTLFLAIGLSPQLAPFLAAGIAGVMLLLFLFFKKFKAKREGKTKSAPQEAFPGEEEPFEPQPLPIPADEIIMTDSAEIFTAQESPASLPESPPPEPEEAATTPEACPAEKMELTPPEHFSGDGVLAQIQERLAMLEEKVARMEDRVMELEEKTAASQEMAMKSEPKIDLQTILAHLDEKEGRVV